MLREYILLHIAVVQGRIATMLVIIGAVYEGGPEGLNDDPLGRFFPCRAEVKKVPLIASNIR